MKNTFLWLLLIVAAIVSCTSGDVTGSRQLSPEQERLEKINISARYFISILLKAMSC